MTALTLMVTLSSVITSCGVTSSVTVRRSILTRRSMPKGMIRRSPGPLSAIRRPSRKSTPRSYSLMMRTAEVKPIRTTRTMMPRTISANMPTGPSSLMQCCSCYGRLRRCGLRSLHSVRLRLFDGLDSQSQAVYREDANRRARGQRAGVGGCLPECALDEDQAIRVERLANGPNPPNHRLFARGIRLLPCGDHFTQDEEEDAGDDGDGDQQQRKVDRF